MMQVATETVATTQDDGILDRLPGRYREMLGELRALTSMSDLCRLAAIKRVQDLKAWCLAHRVSWEEVCETTLPKCRRQIDKYLDTLETFGDGSYEAIIELTTLAEQVAARRLLKAGTLRLEDGQIIIGRRHIANDAAHAYQIVEVLREAFARADAAAIELVREKDLRKANAEQFGKTSAKLHELIDAKDAKLKAYQEAPTPPGLTSEAEQQAFQRVAADRRLLLLIADRIAAEALRPGASGALIYEAFTALGGSANNITSRLDQIAQTCPDDIGEPHAEDWPEGNWPRREEAQVQLAIAKRAARLGHDTNNSPALPA